MRAWKPAASCSQRLHLPALVARSRALQQRECNKRDPSKQILDKRVHAVCRRHACTIDLKRSVLTFGSLSSELPFLAEHEIPGHLREKEVVPEDGQSGVQSTETSPHGPSQLQIQGTLVSGSILFQGRGNQVISSTCTAGEALEAEECSRGICGKLRCH